MFKLGKTNLTIAFLIAFLCVILLVSMTGCVIRKKKNNGRLIGSDVIEHDVTDDIKNILDKHSISHEYDQEVGTFTIYGYR